MRNESAVVLLSGGQDSATCLAIALTQCRSVKTLCFDYGQRHRIEIDCAKKLAEKANVLFQVVDATFINHLNCNALTDSRIDIVHHDGSLPSTFVPGRNLFFLSMAAVLAREWNCSSIYTGVCEADYSGYPDCRSDFIKSANETINLAMETNLDIRTPLMTLTKAQTVLKMNELNCLEWYQDTHTCYEGSRPACGVCPSCVLRLKGFQEAGIEDPLDYRS